MQPCPTFGVSPFVIPYYPPPAKMDLCGEPIPLHDQEVMERFDKEFTLIVYNHAQVYLWFKRMERYFPWLEAQLKCNNLPDDLKYVAIAESDLLPNACSPKGAAGPWQFMPSTGSSFGLDQKGSVDKRYDFEHASHGALRYLQNLHNRFKSWTLAIASYNCGEGRIGEAMRSQGTRDFFQLKLPQETERYVLRILAIKAVLGNPALYGYDLPKGQGYPPLRVDKTCVTLSSSVPIQTAAAAAGTTYREMKRLNPALRSDEIPPGTHEIKVPEGSAKSFERKFPAVSTRSIDQEPKGLQGKTQELNAEEPRAQEPKARESKARESKPQEPKVAPTREPAPAKSAAAPPQAKGRENKQHTIQKGETLSAVARKYHVSIVELKKANQLKDDKIVPGRKLVIP